MSSLQALLLGLVQGLTEFLPISSSGHLQLLETLFGFQESDNLLFFDVVCHIGTLIAIVLFFTREILQLFQKERDRLLRLVIATLPLLPIPFLLGPIREVASSSRMVAFFFLTTALLLLIGSRYQVKTKNRALQSLLIGTSQAVAVFPGLSRSGTTISVGRFLGLEKGEALTFSLLLSIPATLGALALLLLKATKSGLPPSVPFSCYAIGLTTSFIVGYFSIHLMKRLVTSDKITLFVWYCLFLSSILFVFSAGDNEKKSEVKKTEIENLQED